MRESALLRPLRFRFTEPDDARRYGDDWHVYDEAKLVRLPVRELVKLEIEIGMPLVNVLEGVRRETVLGYLAGTWLALRLQNPDLAGPFDDYAPVAMLIVWDRMPPAAEPKADLQAPLDPTPTADSPTSPAPA